MKIRALLLIPALALILISGCRKPALTQSGFILDTFVTVTVYGGMGGEADSAIELCREYDKIFNRHNKDSELYRLNNSGGKATEVSGELSQVVRAALEYCELSGGRYDITIAPVMDLWDFRSGSGKPPAIEAVSEALKSVDYRNIILDENKITLLNGAVIDLGSIAKGYIADRVKEMLEGKNVGGGVINLGGNIVAFGEKPDSSPFNIAIQKPFGESGETAASVKIKAGSVVSSGLYERCFEYNGEFYHHILDARDGWPVKTDIASVTVLSKHSLDGDALSTLCFLLGLEDGMAHIEETADTEAIFITEDGEFYLSSGIDESYEFEEIN